MVKSKYVLLLAALFAVPAVAAEWYIGFIPVISTRADVDEDRVEQHGTEALAARGATGETTVNDTEDSGFGGNLYLGYRRGSFALELAYAHLGKYETTVTSNGMRAEDRVFITTQGEFEAQALSVSAVGHLAIGQRNSIFAKAGLARWQSDNTFRDDGVDIDIDPSTGLAVSSEIFSATTTTTERGTDSLIGIGWEYSETWSTLRLSLDHYFNVGGDSTEKSDITTLGLGVQFRF